MPAPDFTRADFTAAMARLAPTGEVWPKEAGSTFMLALDALTGTPHRAHEAANDLLPDVFPGTTTHFLTDWESTLGLPNLCTPLGSTTEDRIAQIVAKLSDVGGAAKGYFLTIMATAGYDDAAIEEFAPFRVGIDTVETPIYSDDWAFAWWVTASTISTETDAAIACEIALVRPAHTTVWFDFT